MRLMLPQKIHMHGFSMASPFDDSFYQFIDRVDFPKLFSFCPNPKFDMLLYFRLKSLCDRVCRKNTLLVIVVRFSTLRSL
jgi:hypothetical protein